MQIKKVLNRIYVKQIDQAIVFYEKLFGVKTSLRFDYKEKNLELATVGDILIIAGDEEALKLFKETKMTLLVDSIIDFREMLLDNGASIIRDITKVPTGKNMTIRHPDGIIVEYVQHSN